MSNRKCCVPGCVKSLETGVNLHKFPNPAKDMELFNKWVYSIDGDLLQLENNHIFKYRRVCHEHFDEKYWCRNNRLTKEAVPTKNMPDNESQANLDDPMPMECSIDNIQENLPPEQALEESIQESTPVPDLDLDISSALGEAEDTPTFGEKIHDNLSRLWLPILRKGIEKETKEKLMKQYQIPENCTLLQAPKLNPEIAAIISDTTRNKDKRVESTQQQLGLGIAALNKGLSLLLENDTERVKAIKFLSDSSRLLCDLHHVKTEVRKKFMTPGLDKAFLNSIQDVDRDDTLFGQKLYEKIKASKVIEKQGLQIKKPAPKTPASSAQPSTSRLWSQVNCYGPSRYASNRGGRGGCKKTGPAGRKVYQASMKKLLSSTQPQQN